MKNFFYILLFFYSSFTFSQSLESVKNIQKATDISEYNRLVIEFKDKHIFDSLIINDFLLNNPSTKKRFINNSITYEICDIINNFPVYRSTDNVNSAKATKTDALQLGGSLNLNLTGENMTIGVWDGGNILKTHVEFNDGSDRLILTPDNSANSSDSHATHVCGTIGASGVNSAAKGMATKANIKSYNWTNDLSEVLFNAGGFGMLISNHSYGVPVLNAEGELNVASWFMGCYNSDAVSWDDLHYTHPYYLMVTSAGNSGGDSYEGGLKNGFDKLTSEKNAKNNIVVANANPFLSPVDGALINVVINSSSSQGPADDGRIKPDISGDGTNVFSTYNSNTTSYETLSGTSMAGPNVAGSLLLLQEHYFYLNDENYMRSATLKGLVCHTALDAGVSGPDPKFGWGLLDATKAAETITNSKLQNPTSLLSELELTQNEVFTFNVIVSNPQSLQATICWTDLPGTAKNNLLNSPIPALVNDLDLRIKLNGEVFFPWKLQLSDVELPAVKGDNVVDNVEKVEVPNASGIYTIEVYHKGNLAGSAQKFSLVVTGIDELLLSKDSFSADNLKLYPNPSNDILNVYSNANQFTGFEIYDVNGKIVQKSDVENLDFFTVDINELSSGLYVIKFFSNNHFITSNFVKN